MVTEVIIEFTGRGREFVNKLNARSRRVSWGGSARLLRRCRLGNVRINRNYFKVRMRRVTLLDQVGSRPVRVTVFFTESVSVRVTMLEDATEITLKPRVPQ